MLRKILFGSFIVAIFLAGYFVARYEGGWSKPVAEVRKDQSEFNRAVSTIDRKNNHLRLEQIRETSKLPLPPANTPIAEIFDLLKQRADTGDGKAACRLSIELMRCRHAKNMSKYILENTDDSYLYDEKDSEKQKLLIQNGQDEKRLELLEKNKICNSILNVQYKMIFKYLRQAANAGESDAFSPYIDGAGFGSDLSFVRSRDFDVWRSEALSMTESALRRGSPEAVVFLNGAYSEDMGLFSGLVENDPFKAEIMRQLYSQVFATAMPSVKNGLNSRQRSLAKIESERMFQVYFKQQVYRREEFSKILHSAISPASNAKLPCE